MKAPQADPPLDLKESREYTNLMMDHLYLDAGNHMDQLQRYCEKLVKFIESLPDAPIPRNQ